MEPVPTSVLMCALLLLSVTTPIQSQRTCHCQNNGVCVPDVFGFGIQCMCPTGFRGVLCESSELPLVSNAPPTVFNCPEDFEARRQSGEENVFVTWTEPYATDDSGQPPSVERNIAPDFYAVSNYDFNVMYTYTDQAGLMAQCMFKVTVVYMDNSQPAPLFSGCPNDISVTVAGGISTTVAWSEPSAGPFTGQTVSISRSHAPGSVFFLGTTMVTYTFSTGSGQSLCTFEVTVRAESCQCNNRGACIPDAAMTGIQCQCPAGYSGILCEQNNCLCQNNGVCRYDAMGKGIQCECPSGYSGVLCEDDDNACDCRNGGSCVRDPFTPGGIMCICPPEFTGILCLISTATDTTMPTVTFCPSNIRVSAGAGQPALVTWPEPQAQDDSGVAPSVAQNVASGITLSLDQTVDVVYTFTDAAGNVARCEFTVSAVDDVPPVVTFCPPDINQTAADRDAIMFVTWARPKVLDNSGRPPKVLASAQPGIFVMPGNALSVSYVFTDESGNNATCDFYIIINVPPVPPPILIENCPVDVMLSISQADNMALGIWAEPTASRGGAAVPLLQQSHQSGFSFGEGSTLVSYVFGDGSGDEARCNFTVMVTLVAQVAEPPASVGVANVTATSATMTWTGPASAVDGFRVTTAGPAATTVTLLGPEQTSLVLAALEPATDYTVNISSLVGSDANNQVASSPLTLSFRTDTEPDTEAPMITDCPSNITLPAGQSIANWTEPTATDNSGLVPLVNKSHEPGSEFADGSTTVIYTFSDASGNAAECVFTVTRLAEEPDTEAPMITNCPSNITLPAGQSIVNWTEPTATDNSGLVPLVNKSHEPGSEFADGSTTVIYTFTDASGNAAECVFTVIRLLEESDTEAPMITNCPSNITLPAGQSIVNWTEPTATDNSGLVPLVNKSHEPGSEFADGSTTVIYTFTDASGNAAECVFIVIRLPEEPDTEAPMITDCPSNITLPAGQSIANWTEPTATDNSGLVPLVNKSHEPGSEFADGSTTVSYTFTDASGNAAECVFTVIRLPEEPDTEAPMITNCPSNITLPAGQSIANWTEPTATDNSGLVPLVNKSHEPGSEFADGSTTVIYTFTDASGNAAECVFTVIRLLEEPDTEAPMITDCPSNITLPAGQSIANWTEPTATDNSGLVPLVNKSHEPGSEFADGSTTVIYTFTDASGNAAECVFTVIRLPDTEAPMITDCPSNITLPAGQSIANWTEPTATDNSGLVPLVNKSHEPGSEFADGSTTVSYTFTDASGNAAECVFEVKRILVLEPPLSVAVVNLTTDGASIVLESPDVPFDIFIVRTQGANETVPGLVDGVSLIGLTPGNTYVVSVSTAVAYGTENEVVSAPVSVTFTTPDNEPPMVTGCPSDITLPTGQFSAVWTEPSATDNSGLEVVLSKSHSPGDPFAGDSTNVTYTFTDRAGNAAECVFTIYTMLDLNTPDIVGCPSDIALPLNRVVANWTAPTVPDVAGASPVNAIASHQPGASFPDGNTTVSYTFFDQSGNRAVCAFVVTVTLDNVPPVVSGCPQDILLPFGMTVANWTEPSATDDSDGPLEVTKSHEPGTDFGDSNATVVYTFADEAGNQANCSFAVRIGVDDVVPLVTSCPSNITVPFGQEAANWTEPSVTDNSGQAVDVLRSHRPGQTFPEGPTLVTYTFTDASGNQANCVFFVLRLTDNIVPEVSGCPATINLLPGNDVATWVEPVATDNSGAALSVSRSHAPNSTFTENATMVVYTFTDQAGNQASCIFFVKLSPEDLPPVVFDCPANFTMRVLSSEISQGILVIWREPYAVDDSGLEPSETKSHSPGTSLAPGTTPIVYTYTDGAGNQADCTFTVTVMIVDDVAPTIADCPPDMDVTLPLTQTEDPEVSWTPPTATDNAAAAPSLVQSHRPGEGFPEGTTRVSYNFTDSSDNLAVCSFLVRVERERDVEPPTFSNCPSDQSYVIPVGNQFMIIQWNPPTAVDNSGEAPDIESSRDSGDAFGLGTTTVVYTFSDPSGNVASCEFNITLSTPILNPCQAKPCRSNENCFYSGDEFVCVPGLFRRKRETGKFGGSGGGERTCPCQNGGTCQREEDLQATRCICPRDSTGILCQEGNELEVRSLISAWEVLLLAAVPTLLLAVLALLVLLNCCSRQRRGNNKQGYPLSATAL